MVSDAKDMRIKLRTELHVYASIVRHQTLRECEQQCEYQLVDRSYYRSDRARTQEPSMPIPDLDLSELRVRCSIVIR